MTKKEYYEKLVEILGDKFKLYSMAKEEYDKLAVNRKSGIYSYEYINKVVVPKQAELKRIMEQSKGEARGSIENLTREMGEYLKTLDALRPEEMTEDVKLLNSGIPLTKRDLEDIIARNPSNRTMAQLTLRYAEEKGIEGLNTALYNSSESQIEQFKSVQYCSDTVIKWFDNPEVYHRMYGQFIGEGSPVHSYCMGVE